MNKLAEAKKIVVKIGTSTLTYDNGMINLRRIERLIKVLADLNNSGREIILVSSGAIAVGVAELGLKERPQDTPSKQAAAAVGQCELMYLYDKLFAEYGKTVAQILLTRDVVESPLLKNNVINAFNRLLEMGAIPVVNENDSVSVEELEFGDNDTLSAIVAVLVNADALVLLSDIDGLYDDDPRKNPNAQLIPYVHEIDESIEALAGTAGTSRGTGGMVTKVQAAKVAFGNNIPMAIINGDSPALIYDLFDGKPCGTLFIKKQG